jgi:hypothetical protein
MTLQRGCAQAPHSHPPEVSAHKNRNSLWECVDMQTVAEAEEKLKGPHVGVVVIKMIEYIFQRFFF